MGFMFARVQLKYGQLARFQEIMSHIVPAMESKGWRLMGAYRTTLGTLYEVWDLWEVPDANSTQNDLAAAVADPDVAAWAARLPECVETEELRFLSEMTYEDVPALKNAAGRS